MEFPSILSLSIIRTCFDKVSSVKNPNCPVCNIHLKTIAKVLPYAHCSVSKLICAQSREPINESNPPLMLPNGYVYGSKVSRFTLFDFPSIFINSRLFKQWQMPTMAKSPVHVRKKPTICPKLKKCTSCNHRSRQREIDLIFISIFYPCLNIHISIHTCNIL